MEAIISRLEATNVELSHIDEAHLRSLAKKIDSQIDSLDRERAALLSQRKRCRGVLSPLRRFPNELLGEIFSWVVTENSGFKIPTKLSQICKRWREVALNRSDLWTNLVLPLDVGKTFEEQEAAMLKVITTCVQRAQNRPMSLSVDSRSKPGLMPQLLTMVRQATPSVQWKSISVSAALAENLRPLFDRMAQHPKNYTSLTTLHVSGSLYSRKIIPGGIDILSLVNLRSLSIDIDTESERFVAIRIPWSQLTSLTLTARLSSFQYLDILRKCVNLVICSIDAIHSDELDSDSDSDADDTSKEARLPHLKQLKIHYHGEEIARHILISLVAASLEELVFTFSGFPEDLFGLKHSFKCFSDFIIRHAGTLRTLSVPGGFAIRCGRRDPLESLHALKHLHITRPYTLDLGYTAQDLSDNPYDDESMMKLLILDHSLQYLTMPHLESLNFVDHPVFSTPCQKLLDKVISSRCPGQGDLTGPRNLRRIVLGFWNAPERKLYRGMTHRMKDLQRNGFCVQELEPLTLYVFSIE